MSETPAWGFLNPSRQSAFATPPLLAPADFEAGALAAPLAPPAFLAPAFFEMAMIAGSKVRYQA